MPDETILILQLSDLHFGKDGNSPHLEHANQIVSAAISDAPSCKHVLIVLSGDLINRSEAEGFTYAHLFCDDLVHQLAKHDTSITFHGFIATPGNHDTIRPSDHRALLEVENALAEVRKGEGPCPKHDLSLEILLDRQKEYFTFLQALTGCNAFTFQEKFYRVKDLKLTTAGVRIHIINSSWSCFDDNDEGQLLLRNLPPQFDIDRNLVNIAVIHHPIRWFEREDGYLLDELITGQIDITMCGHEHRERTRYLSKDNENTTGYLTAAALTGPRSGFQVVLLHVKQQVYICRQYFWEGSHFVKSGGERPIPLRDELGRILGGVHFSRPFREFVEEANLPTQFQEHDLCLRDIFVYPKLQNITIEIQRIVDPGKEFAKMHKRRDLNAPKQCLPSPEVPLGTQISSEQLADRLQLLKKVIILSDHRRGKTALVRTLVSELRADNLIPVCLRSDDCVEPTTEKVNAHLLKQIASQYAAGCQVTCQQAPKSRMVILIDEFDTNKFSSADLSTLISILEDLSEHLVIVCEELNFLPFLLAGSVTVDILNYSVFRILDLEPKQRKELVEKIVRGVNPRMPEEELDRTIRECEEGLEAVLADGVVSPSAGEVKLIILGIILGDPSRSSAGAHGFYYERQILADIEEGFKGLQQRKRSVTPDTVERFLCLAAREMYRKADWRLTKREVDGVVGTFADDSIDVDAGSLLRALELGRLFLYRNEQYYFRERYQRFYYMAKALENMLGAGEAQEREASVIIDELLDRAHERDAADVILFFFYIRRDQGLLRRVVDRVRACFSDFEQADMDESFGFLTKGLEHREMGKRSSGKELTFAEVYCEIEGASGEERGAFQDSLYSVEDVVRRMSEAFNLVAVMGLATRNNVSVLGKDLRLDIIEAGYDLLRRTLTAFNALIQAEDPKLNALVRRHLKLEAKGDRRAGALASQLAILCSFGIVRRGTRAFGNYRLRPVLVQFWEAEDTPAMNLFRLATELEWKEASPIQARELYAKLGKNVHAREVERWIISAYLRSFKVESERKNMFCNAVQIDSNDPAYFFTKTLPRAFGPKR